MYVCICICIYIYIYIHIYIYIYYYTPLALNLGNNQASRQQAISNQQGLLLSVWAIALPQRSGIYSTLATLEPRWWPCQIQVLSQRLTGRALGWGRQVWRCPPKAAHFVPQEQPFLAQNGPETQSKRPNRGKPLLHSTCASIAPCTRALSCPLAPRYVREAAHKWPKMA